MLENQIDAYVIPTTDPHQSEYPAPRWAAREYFSGFTGSAGTLVVTLHEARLWTDGRYFLQAATQLEGTGIELMKDRLPDTPSIEDWSTANSPATASGSTPTKTSCVRSGPTGRRCPVTLSLNIPPTSRERAGRTGSFASPNG